MPKKSFQKLDTFNFIPSIFLTAYLCIGFVPNWEAVDKIAPQWLLMSLLNTVSLAYVFYFRNQFSNKITQTLRSTMTLTYLGFIVWAAFSYFYAINSTEVLVNITRQVNIFMMFILMGVFIFNIKKRIYFISYVISFILAIEIFVIFEQLINLLDTVGSISNRSSLKGVAANPNITAFSIANKIPFVLFIIWKTKKFFLKIISSLLILLSFIAISTIQSRASFIAIGLIAIAFFVTCIVLYIQDKNKTHLYQLGYFIIPFFISVGINQTFLSDKGADVLSRASTISVDTNDGSINSRLRYYEDVFTHLSSNPFFGVGLGNWKLKSIEYDADDIKGYIVPYHAHNDFIQLGAELGIIGFLLYLGIFLWAIYYVYHVIRFSSISLEEKVFLFLMLTALGVYSIDANLNFPIARPQVLVVWAIIIAMINFYYQKHIRSINPIDSKPILNFSFLSIALITIISSTYVANSVYKSLKGQMFLLQDFNSNQFNVPMNQIETLVPEIPNITVTTIPINSIKARYYFNSGKYDKAITLLEKGTVANPYLYYSELLKSQIFMAKGQSDSAAVYAKKAFFGLPNNSLHSSNYINILNQTRDRIALEEAYELLTSRNDLNNWRNYLIIASTLYPPKDKVLISRAKKAATIFAQDSQIKELYRNIALGPIDLNEVASHASKALTFFNQGEYKIAALNFEKALELNPLEFSYFENAATANYLNGNLQKALDQINLVINEMNPLNGKCEYIKALIFIKMQDPIGACPLLKTAVDSGHSPANATYAQYCNQ